MENKVRTYLRGLGLILIITLLGIVGYITLFAIEMTVFIVVLVTTIGVAILALILTPYFYAKNYEVESKDFKLENIKKREKL